MTLGNRVRRAIKRVLLESDHISARLTLALGEIFWAVMLLWPGDTFSRPTYAHMAMVMPEIHWAVVFAVSAFLQLYIITSEKLHNFFAWQFAGWNFFLWGFTVWSMLASVYPPPAAIGGEIALACTAGWIWIRPLVCEPHINRK